jgi:hypothetical protein
VTCRSHFGFDQSITMRVMAFPTSPSKSSHDISSRRVMPIRGQFMSTSHANSWSIHVAATDQFESVHVISCRLVLSRRSRIVSGPTGPVLPLRHLPRIDSPLLIAPGRPPASSRSDLPVRVLTIPKPLRSSPTDRCCSRLFPSRLSIPDRSTPLQSSQLSSDCPMLSLARLLIPTAQSLSFHPRACPTCRVWSHLPLLTHLCQCSARHFRLRES